jgi:DNA-binding beta-propeller fold protein YncE
MLACALVGAIAVVSAPLGAVGSHAEGKFVKADRRADVAYDDAHGILYITNSASLLRYDVNAKAFLSPIVLGGILKGVDISPDGTTLAIADSGVNNSKNKNWIHLFDIATQTDKKVRFTRESLEGGTWSVAYGADGRILISSWFDGSGPTPLRRYDPVTGATTTLTTVQQVAHLGASADREYVGIGNYGNSDVSRYRVADGNLLQAGSGSGSHSIDIAVAPAGKYVAVVAPDQTSIRDKDLATTGHTIGTGFASTPLAAAFHPTQNLVYFPWSSGFKIEVYSTDTWTKVDSYAINRGMGSGRPYAGTSAKISADGSLLFVTVAKGVLIIHTGGHHAH